ncbi:PadR family transcriptional regulator [Kineosporia sp. NBRC 101731]|uniref:PadR family transcriptional regulator n=1 Tax=Kineosporia sp. NBRC 101731 TaxID=3032199 RepID=UPI0024A13C45|nr:PadR family transcriptional regulator [Kineosporia sp. NBRC 101731]GLY26899.1 PadR family transcriptional regulator [Kineosporia sp. NBRC 101731]
MGRRSDVLELAVLGLLQESGLHGYELRKRLNALLGPFRALSYGTLYPCLKSLLAAGWIHEAGAGNGADTATPASPLAGRRAKIVYELTAEGKERFQSLVSHPGPAAWEDERFDVHFAFFARTDAGTRLQILEGRRSRLEERREGYRQSMHRSRERAEQYTLELQRHGLESVDREVRWLSELIDTERASNMTHPPHDGDRPPLPAPAPGPDHESR